MAGRGNNISGFKSCKIFLQDRLTAGKFSFFLRPGSQIFNFSPWNTSLAGWGLLQCCSSHDLGRGWGACLLCSFLGPRRKERAPYELLCCFTFLVLEIARWCCAESPSLPEGNELPSWTEVLSKRTPNFLIANNSDIQTGKSYSLKLKSQWCEPWYLSMSCVSGLECV